jgi:hypothetical protein
VCFLKVTLFGTDIFLNIYSVISTSQHQKRVYYLILYVRSVQLESIVITFILVKHSNFVSHTHMQILCCHVGFQS